MMHDAIDAHDSSAVAVENKITVAVKAAEVSLEFTMAMTGQRMASQVPNFGVKAAKHLGGLARAIDGDESPDVF
jgi:hypothetical protein